MASLAVLIAIDGDRDATEALLPGAYAAAVVLEAATREALMAFLAEARRMAGTGVTT